MNRFGGTIGLFTVALLWGSAMVEAGLGAETCAAAAKKDTSGYFQSISESLYAIDGSLPTNVDGDCLPTETTNKVGAWFNLNVDGLLGLEIDSRVYASSLSTTVPHEVAVMRGSCGSLTCLASGSARPDERDRMLIEVPFNLTTNDDY
ncbi:expressed unknown protein [Seminavis robusta]|uniref:Uncharacterized protein n=1 Tax=Seminavis robusta TaxID=568900 RepID=A0A9N8DC42_9STRA|nr:expressed unknown protein [Seminavis robusta]|eukprot:Sro25_g017080.1 n/a (148) ;mRNA; f:111557-112000